MGGGHEDGELGGNVVNRDGGFNEKHAGPTGSSSENAARDGCCPGSDQIIEDEGTKVVRFRKLFSFADSTDIVLMVLGTIGVMANGVSMPLITLLFGNLTDSFGESPDIKDVVDRVSKVSLQYVYLAIGAGLASFLRDLLDGHRREAGNEDQESVLEDHLETGDRLLRQGDEHGGSRGKDVRRHRLHSRRHGREDGVMVHYKPSSSSSC
ncbi:unnamed protein product [Spirodela intermedia]|uniref:Uncharacterized protein n=1 Tax=Spirodela intermedia TaxID=51605 RepID=A0A7I8L6X9_SPIIN|nr:unnamed protein product [Spirodela intermedia]